MSRIFANHWNDYELIDAGGGKKLERWGRIVTIRPDRNAYFQTAMPFSEWNKQADFEFEELSSKKGNWKVLNKDAPRQWVINYGPLKFKLELTDFKHLGLFPEQEANWSFIEDNIGDDDRFLNLFGYTGAASLVARQKGAEVIHCDAVKQVISWTRENMELSNLSDIKWVLEDALKFAKREVKRGHAYQGIIMDPPAFGIGAKKERWKIEDKFSELMELALKLRAPQGFLIVNTYSPKLKAVEIQQMLRNLVDKENYKVDILSIKSTSGKVLEYGERTLVTD